MPDGQHRQFLLITLDKPKGGAQLWQGYKRRWQDQIDLAEADMSGLSLKGYDLSKLRADQAILASADLDGALLWGTSLRYADLRGCNLRMARLSEADLSFAILNNAHLADASLAGANLKGAHLVEADLSGADLTGADLTGADLRKAVLKYAKLDGAILRGANLSEANLTGVVVDSDVLAQGRNSSHVVIDAPRPFLRLPLRKFLRRRPGSTSDRVDAPDASQPATEPQPAGATQPDASQSAAAAGQAAKPQSPPQAIAGTGHGMLYEEGGATVPCWTVAPDLSTVIGCCQTLEVATSASMDEIVKAFRVKAKLYHPDRVRHLSPRFQELATEEFYRLHRAYEQLTRATARPMVGIVWVAGLAPKESAYDYTIDEYRLLAQANQNNANVLYNLAWKCFEAGLHQEASDVFLRVLALNPTDQDAAYNAAVCKTFVQLSEVLA